MFISSTTGCMFRYVSIRFCQHDKSLTQLGYHLNKLVYIASRKQAIAFVNWVYILVTLIYLLVN